MGPNPTTMTLIICSVCSGSRAARETRAVCRYVCPCTHSTYARQLALVLHRERWSGSTAPGSGTRTRSARCPSCHYHTPWTLQTPVFWAYLPSIQNIITGLLTANFKISGTIIFMCMLKSMGLERSMTRGTLTWWLHILMRMTRVRFLIKRSQCPDVPSQAAMLRVRNQMAGIVLELETKAIRRFPCDNCIGVPISRLLTVGSTPI